MVPTVGSHPKPVSNVITKPKKHVPVITAAAAAAAAPAVLRMSTHGKPRLDLEPAKDMNDANMTTLSERILNKGQKV